MTLPENGLRQPVEIVVASTLPRNGYVQPVEVVAGPGVITGGGVAGQVAYFDGPTSITGNASLTYVAGTGALTIAGSLTLSAITPTHVLYAGTGGLVSGDAGLTYVAASDQLQIGSEGALYIATQTSTAPYTLRVKGDTFNGTRDDALAISYNASRPYLSVADYRIDATLPAFQVTIEADYNDGAARYMEWNSDYRSSDGLTYRRGFTLQINRATHVQTWKWYGSTHSFWSNDAITQFGNFDSNGTLNLFGGNAADAGVPLANIKNNRIVTFLDSAAGTTNCGFLWFNTSNQLNFGAGNATQGQFRSGVFSFQSALAMGWSSTSDPGGTLDVLTSRGGPGIFDHVDGGNAQTVRIFGTTVGSRHLVLSHNGTDALITTDASGSSSLRLGVNTSSNWLISGATGHFLAATDNVNDIGASGATRPRTLYLGTSIVVGTAGWTISATAATGMTAQGNARFSHGTSALATTATEGYMFMQSCAGDPTGVPASIPTGQKAWQYNSTAKTLWLYDGAWVKAKVAGIDVVFA